MCGFPPVLIDAIKRGAKVQYKSRIPYQVWLPSLNHESEFATSIVINNQNLKSSRRMMVKFTHSRSSHLAAPAVLLLLNNFALDTTRRSFSSSEDTCVNRQAQFEILQLR